MTMIRSARLAEKAARIRSLAFAPSVAPLDPVEAFLARLVDRNCSAHTLRAYRGTLEACAAFLGKPVAQATEADLERWLRHKGRKVKPSTVRRFQTTLRSFFRFCLRAKLVTEDPTLGFESPKVDDLLPRHMSPEQIATLLASLDASTKHGAREAAIIKTFYLTGMRSCELVRLDVADVLGSEIRVYGKGKKERMLPVSAALREALDAWLAVHPTGTGALFCRLSPTGHRLGYDAVRRIVKAALRRVGLGKFSNHCFRHTTATRLLQNGMPLERIQKLLGHRQISTTLRYANVEIDARTRADMERML